MKIKTFHFVIFWLVVNVLQGGFSELTSDEGYYWFYSTSPQLGYYDHPPLLAWIIAIGYSLFQNELGVRFFNIIMSGATLFLFFRLVSPRIKNQWPAFLLILSMPLLNYLSFIVFPDGPLLFFTIIFLSAYKSFLEKRNFSSSLTMGIALALMLYSKYHGLLILSFTILSNLRLMRSRLFFLSLIIALILFSPHLFWQYQNGFPAVKYHLSGRMSDLSINHVFEYLSQQILVIGPALILVPFIYKTTGQFEKTLKFIVLGTFIFFLVASFKVFIHFHWTSVVILPLLFLSVRFYSNPNRLKLLLYLTLPVMGLILVARAQLMVPIIPLNHVNVDYYHGRKIWARDIAKLASSDTVVFQDNFREASLFSFYSKKTGSTIFSEVNRKSQYDLWHYEASLQHKNLLYIRYEPFDGAKEFITGMGKKIYYTTLNNFSSYFNVLMKATCIESTEEDDFISICIDIGNPRQETLGFKKDETGNRPVLYYKVVAKKTIIQRGSIKNFFEEDSLPVKATRRILTRIPLRNLKAGRYKIIFGFQFGKLKDSENEEITVRI